MRQLFNYVVDCTVITYKEPLYWNTSVSEFAFELQPLKSTYSKNKK